METLRLWVKRVRLLLRRSDAELDEEMAFHLDREAEKNVAAGMSPEEARRRAMVAFGGVQSAKENCREARPGFWMEALAQDVRYALRGFRRSPVFTLTIVV